VDESFLAIVLKFWRGRMTKVQVAYTRDLPESLRPMTAGGFKEEMSELVEKGYEIESCGPLGDEGVFCILKKEE